MHIAFTLWMNFTHIQMIHIVNLHDCVNVYFTTILFYISVFFMTCSTSYCFVTVSGINGMYICIVLYCIVLSGRAVCNGSIPRPKASFRIAKP